MGNKYEAVLPLPVAAVIQAAKLLLLLPLRSDTGGCSK